jgi:hypothetical protein
MVQMRPASTIPCPPSKANTALDYCGTRYPADKLEAQALQRLQAETQPWNLGRLAREAAERQRQSQSQAAAEQLRLETALDQVDQEERKVALLIVKGIADHIVDEMLRPLKQRRRQLTAELQRVQAATAATADPDRAEAWGEAIAAEVRGQWERIRTEPAAFQEAAQRLLVITLWQDRKPEIEIRLPRGA